MMATPNPMTTVAASSASTPGLAPRNAEPTALITSPAISVASAPNRAISSDPGTAAPANNMTGRPTSTPTSVAESAKSALIIGMVGGIARMVRRSAMPASHSNTTAMRNRLDGKLSFRGNGEGFRGRPPASHRGP